MTAPPTDIAERACMVSIEIDARQRYLFETDKWQEMLGASRIIHQTRVWARELFADRGLHLVQPVSGEIRAWAKIARRAELLDLAWELRLRLAQYGVEHTCGYLETDDRHFLKHDEPVVQRSPTDEPLDDRTSIRSTLSAVHRRMTSRVGLRKSAKAGSDARPVCSLFAPCRLHGFDFANEWRTAAEPGEPDEPRRRQRGYRAAAKQKQWRQEKTTLTQVAESLREQLKGHVADVATVLEDLELDFARHMDATDGQQDRYVGFLCADGDGFGSKLLPALDWNCVAWNDAGVPAWQRNARFVEALNDSIDAAFHTAMLEVSAGAIQQQVKDGQKGGYHVPVLLQLLGGDDLWVLARRDVALDLARQFSDNFTVGAAKNAMLQDALKVANTGRSKDTLGPLTISIGVAFAKSGYPIHAMAEAAESLLAQAKRLRKGEGWDRRQPSSGCLDWHRIESSLSESVKDARRDGWQYKSHEPGVGTLLLTTRPWATAQANAFLAARTPFNGLARRKRQQLEDVLRRGYTLSLLAWEGWWKRLSTREQDYMRAANAALKEAGCNLPAGNGQWEVEFLPWEAVPSDAKNPVYRTPWLDLMALDDVICRPGEDEGARS